MKFILVSLAFIVGFSMTACSQVNNPEDNPNVVNPEEGQDTVSNHKIQVALLLDTSNSMDGLIEQAKMRLWNIVNTLTTLKYEGKEPIVEISLYQYGNDRLAAKEDWVQLIVPLTRDLDNISEKLFALRTQGGTEFCGSVINHAAKNLQWDQDEKSLKLVYIAGNESFDQKGMDYKEAVSAAKNAGIFINTIYCGNYEQGVNELWRDGATLGNGKYFNIDPNKAIRFIETPYDDSITVYNVKLNETYLNYNRSGASFKSKQIMQDDANAAMSESAAVERTISKSKSNAYNNSHWDLVDAYEKDPEILTKLKKEEMSEELKSMSPEELKKHIEKLQEERKKNQEEITRLAKERQAFLDQNQTTASGADDLGVAIEKSILELAKLKGYKKG